MITVTVLLALLERVKAWAWHNKWNVGLALIATACLLWLLFGRERQRPDIKIYDPRTEINAIQREKDRRIDSDFNAIDRRRQEDDNRIRQSNRRTRPNRNVNAQELEDLLK